MKNNNLKRFLLTGIVIIFLGLLQSCEMKDGDDFYPMRFNLLENSNHDNVLVTFDRTKNRSDVIHVDVSSEGGTLKFECINYSDLEMWTISSPIEEGYDKHCFANEWMELKAEGRFLYLNFPKDVILEENVEFIFGISDYAPSALDGRLIVRRTP